MKRSLSGLTDKKTLNGKSGPAGRNQESVRIRGILGSKSLGRIFEVNPLMGVWPSPAYGVCPENRRR